LAFARVLKVHAIHRIEKQEALYQGTTLVVPKEHHKIAGL
jgi:hypothetical protein